ncbi:glycosyltransferase [uncultured Prevotella sp.]|uniref:glycosyltransferase family protein n=1 Tax=uncultured Prevotella sp. TaxID=159272 RepID=UPI00262C8BBF|nr:glycosyltransferase [uncultured Prevotella sp.]
MKVYFYHTQNIQYCLSRMQQGEFPSHFLYGACHLSSSGIDVVYHRSPSKEMSRLKTALYTAWRVLTCREHIDAVYATHYKGLELLILLRAIGIFRKPIVVWHHQPIVTPKSKLREWGGRLFYRGMDRLIFFSQKLVDDSLHSPKANPKRMVVGHWGADLDFYDRMRSQEKDARFVFIATGKEQRDQHTLIEAFNRTGLPLKLYIGINPDPTVPNPNLDAVRSYKPAANIDVREICGLLPYEIALDVAKAQCVAICCKHTRYTAGLTTVVEALALGLPMVCSRNPQIPIDFDREGCGISVEYGDVEGWQRATSYLASHPDEARRMGERGRQIAEERFNDRQCASEVAAVLKEAAAQNKPLYIPIKLVNIVLAIIAAVLLVLCINTLRGIH